jgi:N-methylhydantoinase B
MGPADGFHTQGKGQQGGWPSQLNKAYIIREGRTIEIKESHIPQDLKGGDIFVAKAMGGAGVGLPEERDPEAVRQDVKYGLVSIEMARDVYKVSIDPETLEIYESATRKMRKQA